MMSALILLLVAQAAALTCEGYGEPVEQGVVSGSPVNESSGLAYARTRAGVWFTHNDAGGQPSLYAFELGGAYLGEHPVTGSGFGDWEALSSGPCPDGDGACLYIGDVGDNGRTRPYVSVYAVREPALDEPAEVIATWHAIYPDGAPQDSEALLVHPRTGRIELVTKDDADHCWVYRFPLEPGDVLGVLEPVARISIEGEGGARTVTGADWDLDGERVVLRTYTTAWEWSTDPCAPDAHWQEAPRGFAMADGQGEAIAYNAIGDIVVSSEGDPMVLKRLVCDAVGEDASPCDSGPVDSDPDGSGIPDRPVDDGCGCGGGVSVAWLALWGLPALWIRSRSRRGRDRSRRP